MSATTVTCPICSGCGQRPLTHTERVTLAEVPRIAWSSTGAIRERLGNIKNPALCNRLADLERLGLVKSRVCATNHRVKEWRKTP